MINDNIENYYKNIDKPIINEYMNNLNFKNLLALSTINDLYVFQKEKKAWRLKDKEKLLRECEYKRKKKIKEVSVSLNSLNKNKSSTITKEIKLQNNTLLNQIENIDSLIETIEKIFPIVNNNFDEIYSN
uniref:Uncharacterized protein n=1 Tax=viral metagenome TaxID=1070528 RepID=A0A6C0DA68_9ZZZZ